MKSVTTTVTTIFEGRSDALTHCIYGRFNDCHHHIQGREGFFFFYIYKKCVSLCFHKVKWLFL